MRPCNTNHCLSPDKLRPAIYMVGLSFPGETQLWRNSVLFEPQRLKMLYRLYTESDGLSSGLII